MHLPEKLVILCPNNKFTKLIKSHEKNQSKNIYINDLQKYVYSLSTISLSLSISVSVSLSLSWNLALPFQQFYVNGLSENWQLFACFVYTEDRRSERGCQLRTQKAKCIYDETKSKQTLNAEKHVPDIV